MGASERACVRPVSMAVEVMKFVGYCARSNVLLERW